MSEASFPASVAPSEGGSPSIVTRKVGAGIQARLARLQGAAGPPVVTREMPKKFANGYDDPFRERLDGTLRRSMSGTWSVNALEADTSAASTDGSQTLIDVPASVPLPTVAEAAELKRRRDFTKSWEKEQEAVADQLLSPEPPIIQSSSQPIIQSSSQPIIEEPEPEEEEVVVTKPITVVPAIAPVQDDPKHGILTPPISEPETPKRKTEPKPLVRPHTTATATRLRPPPPPAPSSSTSTVVPKTPTRSRPRPSAPMTPASTLAPPILRPRLTPSPARPPPRASLAPPRASLAPPRAHTSMSMSTRRASAPARPLSSKIPDKILPPPVRPRTISKVYEGPTFSSLAKQRPAVSSGLASRAVSRAGFS